MTKEEALKKIVELVKTHRIDIREILLELKADQPQKHSCRL